VPAGDEASMRAQPSGCVEETDAIALVCSLQLTVRAPHWVGLFAN
jgi:hypothetical protein